MDKKDKILITVTTKVKVSIDKVWKCWTSFLKTRREIQHGSTVLSLIVKGIQIIFH
jgi:hypothetical protein